ncbi:unnamed protein product [Lactuca virosa]|uniref:Uncharacterized protein n=1 Tax=Lactuca virosa TaxID=75947 RepID=A0AAU9LIB8_9ASTR|nr:unnamed protein product [Lactuca virosa]
MPGRPKTKRKRHVSEVNDSKFPTVRARICRTVRCSKCLQFGHNLKSCKNEQVMKEYVPPRKPRRPMRDVNGITNKDGEGTSKQKKVKLTVKRKKKKTKKAGEGSSNQATFETANDATVQETANHATGQETVQEEIGTVQETAHEIVNDADASIEEIDVLMLQKCCYEPHEIAHALERVNVIPEPVSPVEMEVNANEIEDHLEADLEENVNQIEDNLLEDNLEMVVDANEIVPPVQREVAIQGLDANAWVGEDDEEIDGDIDFIEDTQVVGRPRKMNISEKIVKINMKKAVYEKDGRGSSIKKPVNLE